MLSNSLPSRELGIRTGYGLSTVPKTLTMMTSSMLTNTTRRVKVILMPPNLGSTEVDTPHNKKFELHPVHFITLHPVQL
jgi:hypothetical protein